MPAQSFLRNKSKNKNNKRLSLIPSALKCDFAFASAKVLS